MPSEGSRDPRSRSAGRTPTTLRAHLDEIHRLLLADRESTAAHIADLTRNVTSIVEATRFTATDDEHDPEGATIAFERSQAGALLAAADRHLAEVDSALVRLAEDRYGRCERCGEPIAPERLLVRPAARTCIACATSTAPPRRGRR